MPEISLSFDSPRQIDYPQRHDGVEGKAKIQGRPAAQGKVRAKARTQIHAKIYQDESQAKKDGNKKSGQDSGQAKAIGCAGIEAEGFRQVSQEHEGLQGRSQIFA